MNAEQGLKVEREALEKINNIGYPSAAHFSSEALAATASIEQPEVVSVPQWKAEPTLFEGGKITADGHTIAVLNYGTACSVVSLHNAHCAQQVAAAVNEARRDSHETNIALVGDICKLTEQRDELRAQLAALSVPSAPVALFDRKLADLERRGYSVIGRILHKDGEYALFDSSCRWLTSSQYQRLMHEQDGSLFADCAAPQPSIPGALFDGYAVLQEVNRGQCQDISPEHVSAVLDAVVRLIRAPEPSAPAKCHDDGGNCGAGGYCGDCHQPAPVGDEDSAFEEWKKTLPEDNDIRSGYEAGDSSAWEGWQARAALHRPAASVPDGWQIVPIQPTSAMIALAQFHTEHDDDVERGDPQNYRARSQAMAVYSDMLAAAPTPDAP